MKINDRKLYNIQFTLEELEAVRAKKADNRGGFEKKILLIETIEK